MSCCTQEQLHFIKRVKTWLQRSNREDEGDRNTHTKNSNGTNNFDAPRQGNELRHEDLNSYRSLLPVSDFS